MQGSNETKILVIILIFMAILIPLVLLYTTNSFIKALENLDTPESPEINNISDLYKLEEYKSNLIDFIFISVFARIFEGFTGRTVLETLKGIQLFLILVLFVELIIIVGMIYLQVSTTKKSGFKW